MFDERMEMDLSTLGPLAERAVGALESIAQSLSAMARTAELQAEILTKHHHPQQHSDPRVFADPCWRELTEEEIEHHAFRLRMTPETIRRAHEHGVLPPECYAQPLRSVPAPEDDDRG